MTILTYSRGRLQIAAVLFSLSALMVVLRFSLVAGVQSLFGATAVSSAQLGILFPLTFLFVACVLGRIFFLMSGDLVALRVLPEGLEVTGFLGRRVVHWDGLLGGHRVNYGSFLHRNRWFNVRYLVDGANKTARVPLILTRRPDGGQMSLPEKIDKAREEALGRPRVPGVEHGGGGSVDPDAAIARYLKAKAEAAAEAGAVASVAHEPALARVPNRPAFGRKGL